LDRNAERWALLVFYVLLVVTMAVEVLAARSIFLLVDMGRGELSVIRSSISPGSVRHPQCASARISALMSSCITLARGMKALLYMLGDLVMLAVALVALYWSFETVTVSWKFGSVSHGLRVSMVWFLLAVPIGFTLLIVRLIQSFIHDFNSLRTGKPVFEGNQLFD
jgi:C4-dicarboxylate transporter DctQ subunit